ncbi:MAG: DUF1579 domain-containing protein [Planctomycetota bacterium]
MKLVSLFALLSFALPLAAQDTPEMPKPGKEHQKLQASVGTWDAVMEMTGEDGKPMTSKGVSVRHMAAGGFFLIDDFEGEMMGMKFVGHGLTGYDPLKGKYVGTWIDSMSPNLGVSEGGFDKEGKVLTMTMTGPGMDGKPVTMRMVSTMTDANTEVFEMFAPGPDGKEMRMMKITYNKRVEKKK